MLAVVRKLDISKSLSVSYISVRASFLLNVEKMGFPFWSGQQKEVSNFGKESNSLIALFLAGHPRKNFLLRQIAILDIRKTTSGPLL